MEKACAKCGLQFQCGADTPECWCKSIAVYESARAWAMEQYSDCLCKTCLSMMLIHPSVWEIGRKEHR